MLCLKAKQLTKTGLKSIYECKFKCIPSHLVQPAAVYAGCQEHLEMNAEERRVWLATILRHSSTGDRFSPGPPVPATCTSLCYSCVCASFGMQRSFFYRVRRATKGGDRQMKHKAFGGRRVNGHGCDPDALLQWLIAYAKRSGDFMPDFEQIHLPDYKWTYVHLKAENELQSIGLKILTYQHFRRLVKSALPHIKIRKFKRFTKCTQCKKLDMECMKHAASSAKGIFWRQKKEEHIQWETRERAKYTKHREESTHADTKHKSICISIDGMDHSKTSCGRMAREDKETEKNVKLETHVTGALAHGRSPSAYAYTWYDRFPSGSDVVTTILVDVLRRVQEKEPLPPRLNLWLDNCWRENKNR
jgi:hypothetical protein